MIDQGEINYIISMSITRNHQAGIIRINKSEYLQNVLKHFCMDQCRPMSTPMEARKSFEKLSPNEEPVDVKNYQAAIDSLKYASIGTRSIDVLLSGSV